MAVKRSRRKLNSIETNIKRLELLVKEKKLEAELAGAGRRTRKKRREVGK